MSSEMRTVKATCLCGTASHEVTLKQSDFPVKGYMCHCNSCRRMTGTMALTAVFLPPYYEPAQAVLDKLTSYVFTKRITQYFCTQCGCQMLARCLKNGDDPNSQVTWDVPTGTLEHIEDVVDWQGHEHLQDTLDGGFAEILTEVGGKTLDRWPANFGERKQLPFPWSLHQRPQATTSADDKLLGKCRCEGVEFYISPPSARSAFVKRYWPDTPPADVSNLQVPSEDEAFYLQDKGRKFLVGQCACNSCRLAAGTEITTWAFVPTADISLDKAGKVPWSGEFGTLKKYKSSPDCDRYFCGRCGAIVFYDAEDRAWLKDVAVGVLIAPEGARAESWLGWWTGHLGHKVDAIPRAESLALAVEKGLKDWEERVSG